MNKLSDRPDWRSCERCGAEYIKPFGGGTKFCKICQPKARLEQIASYGKGEFNEEPQEDRSHEYSWEYACGTCGIKHASREDSIDCCALAWDRHQLEPHHHHGGDFWVLNGKAFSLTDTKNTSMTFKFLIAIGDMTSIVPAADALRWIRD